MKPWVGSLSLSLSLSLFVCAYTFSPSHSSFTPQIANTKTSIAFGSDAYSYETTMQRGNRTVGEARAALPPGPGDGPSAKDLKQGLSKASWSLGDEKLTYGTTNTLEDPTHRIHLFQGASHCGNPFMLEPIHDGTHS